MDDDALLPIDDICDHDKEIIDFISDRETYYNNESKSKVIEDVRVKYGDTGVAMYNQLNEESSPENEENLNGDVCPDCAEKADEWIRQSQKSLRVIEDCMDESLTDIANSIIDDDSIRGSRISREDIVNAISQATGKKALNIKDKEIERVCRKIIFLGMIDGWLIDEYFIDMQTANDEDSEDYKPSDPLERR